MMYYRAKGMFVQTFVGSSADLKKTIEWIANQPGVMLLQVEEVPNVPNMWTLLCTPSG